MARLDFSTGASLSGTIITGRGGSGVHDQGKDIKYGAWNTGQVDWGPIGGEKKET